MLTTVLGPLAKAIKCLESAHITPGDVYLYWLAILSQLESVFSERKISLDTGVMEDIRQILNRRFSELMDGEKGNIYISAFVLDPSKQLGLI